MRRYLSIALVLFVMLLSLSAKDTDYIPRYTDTGRLIPATQNGFEVVQGRMVFSPIDPVEFERAALVALKSRGYIVRERKSGEITYTLIRKDYDLTMKLKYNENEYWYEYVGSNNLKADPERNRIHKSYFRWLENLEVSIGKEYRV